MSLPEPLQCLFCNHLNPCGASFCNECGSQLHLQQCDLCGSINKRSAKICYKCGVAFTLAVPSAFAAEHQEMRGDGSLAVCGGVVEARQSVVCDHPAGHSPADQTLPVEPAATEGRHRQAVTLSAIALATLIVCAYYFPAHSLQGALEPTGGQIARAQSADSLFVGGSPWSPGTEVDAAAGSGGTMKRVALRVFGFDVQRPLAPDAALTKGRSTAVDSVVATDREAAEECRDAVAALGLCDWTPRLEKP